MEREKELSRKSIWGVVGFFNEIDPGGLERNSLALYKGNNVNISACEESQQ